MCVKSLVVILFAQRNLQSKTCSINWTLIPPTSGFQPEFLLFSAIFIPYKKSDKHRIPAQSILTGQSALADPPFG
jgi:hypothetical protein